MFDNRLLHLVFRSSSVDESNFAREFLNDDDHLAGMASTVYLLERNSPEIFPFIIRKVKRYPESPEWLAILNSCRKDRIPSSYWWVTSKDGAFLERYDEELRALTQDILTWAENAGY